MILELIDEIVTCFAIAIEEIQVQEAEVTRRINPPVCREDDEAELAPLTEIDLDEIPF